MGTTSVADMVVSRLVRKAPGRYGKMIETVSKMGYYLAPPPENGRKTGRREQ